MSALQVVYNNLRKIGLEKYAIPIHDSKVNKTHILQELAWINWQSKIIWNWWAKNG
nr:hypothetical protein [Mycoplasmopsis bovis]